MRSLRRNLRRRRRTTTKIDDPKNCEGGGCASVFLTVHSIPFTMRVIYATYSSPYATFRIPNHIKLLSVEENNKVKDEDVPFSWYIRWCVLHYLDENGDEHEIESVGDEEHTIDWKRPKSVEEGEEEDDHQ
jgi:hypothetical protein